MALGYQLVELLKEGLLKEYLEVDDRERQGEAVLGDPPHETLVHGELNTISVGSRVEEARQPSVRGTCGR